MKGNKVLIVVVVVVALVILGCCGICLLSGTLSSTVKTSNSNQTNPSNMTPQTTAPVATTPAAPAKPQDGEVISGIARKDIEDQFNAQKALSDLKASNYIASIKGKQVVWVGTVTKIDNQLFGTGYDITMMMGGYTVDIGDTAKKYGTLNQGQVVKVSATIDNVIDIFGGITVNLVNPTITVIS